MKSLTYDISTNRMETRELEVHKIALLDSWSSQHYHSAWEGVSLSVYLINKKHHNNMYIGKDKMKSGTYLVLTSRLFQLTQVFIIVCIGFE